MKRKILSLLLAILILLSIPGTLLLASDISNALYEMTILVSNNSTATTYVATNGTNISTPNLIAGDFLSASANECAVLDAAGSDVPFMPGYSTNAWCFWVSSIPAYSYLNYYLYTANSTGGEIRYFPSDSGMEVDDAAGLEPGNDFEHELIGWLNTADSNFTFPMQKRAATSIAITDTAEVSGIIYFDDPIEVTPAGAGAWTDVDISEYVPSYATGAVLHLVNTAGANRSFGIRMNGSGDNRYYDMNWNAWTMIGVDANKIFECEVENIVDCDVYLVGFTGEDVTFNLNADDISLGGAGAWTNIDLAALAPEAVGVIVEVINTDVALQTMGLRKDGSADNRTAGIQTNSITWGIIGCDGSQVIEGWVGNLNVDFFLLGYITDNYTFATDATDKSLAALAAWTDIDCSAQTTADTTHLIFEVISNAALGYGFRRNGSAENIVQECERHNWVVVECDSDQIVEGYINNANCDFFLIGYTEGYIDDPYEAIATATSIASGDYTTNMAMDTYFLGLWVDTADQTLPELGNLFLNIPLWQNEFDAAGWNTIDGTADPWTVNGATWSTANGYDFSGVNQWLNRTGGTMAQVSVAATFSVEMWFKVDTVQRSIFFINSDGANDRVMFGISAGGSLGLQCLSPVAVTHAEGQDGWTDTTNWHHIVGTSDGALNFKCYIDGVLQTGGQWAGSGFAGCRIGSDNGGWDFDGKVRDVRIYTKELSQAEVTQNYNATRYYYDGDTDRQVKSTISAGVPDVTTDWYYFLKAAMPYVESASIDVAGVPISAWEWEYDATFHDSIGANDATPSFRTSSSDADVEATAVSFQPVEEAKAPSYTMDTTTATWLTASNVTGNFTTTPTPTYPGHEVIDAVSAATGTPSQLPYTVLFGFFTLAISLSISAVLRNYGSRSLFVKTLVIGLIMGICEALQIVDFWELVFFLVMALTIMAASKYGDVV